MTNRPAIGRAVMYFTDSPDFGGAEQVLLTLMAGIRRHDWRVTLAHSGGPGAWPLAKQAQDQGIIVRELPQRSGSGALSRAIEARALAQLLRSERPDVFHVNLTWPLAARYALLTATLVRIPAVVATIHSFDVEISSRTAMLHRLLCSGVDRYIAVSNFIASRVALSLRIPPAKVRVVPNGIQLTAPEKRARARRNGADRGPQKRSVVLTPARLDPVKGHATLLAAAARVPDVNLLFAGDGTMHDQLAAEANQLGVADRAQFLGHRSDIPDLLARCDMVVLPSLCEGFGLAVVEAMAAGKPVIASRAGALPELVRDGETGLLVTPGDPDALADAMRRLIADPVLAQRLARQGRFYAQRTFGAESMVDGVASVYAEALGGA